jgi:Zn ribbon nucleic-acid-binding protein
MEAIVCPACGEEDALRGVRDEDGRVVVACERCGHEWVRDLDVCPRCGRRSIADVREPLFQKARGTQQSIVGYRIVHACWACGFRDDRSTGDPAAQGR